MRWAPLLLMACVAAPPDGLGPQPDPLTADGLLVSTRALTDLGARQVATPAEAEAHEVVVELLEGAGLAVGSEPFAFEAWLPGTASVTVGGVELPAQALSPSPPTDTTAPLVDGTGGVRDGVALMSSDDASRAEQYLRAVSGGAVAMIRVTEDVDFDGSPLVEVGHTVEGTTFASVAVDRPTGDDLREALGQDVRVHIAPVPVPAHTSFNVVGRVPGRVGGAVYVVAHYDSWHPSESAFDNALGVGALVQLAHKVASGPQPDRDVVFLATSGEEQGLQGAIAWVADHADEVGPGDLVLTLDVLWSGEGRFLCMATDPELVDAAVAASAEEGLDAVAGGDPGLGSDHFPFVVQGADALWCGRWPDRHYHTVGDTLDQLDLDEASAAMRAQWRVLADAAGLEP